MTAAAAAEPKLGDPRVTLATFLYLVNQAGHPVANPQLAAACAAVGAADAEAAAAAGAALVEAVGVPAQPDAVAVQAWLDAALGQGRAGALSLPAGADQRDARARALRSYQFRTSLPLLVQMVDRFPDGSIGSHWVMVERVTDTVTLMDPYPWDDVDEELQVPLLDFLVKWELAGTVCFAVLG